MTLYKKFFSILCSLFMALGMGTTPILADENDGSSSTNTPTYSITIENAIDGSTYKAYKIFDASGSEDDENITYTISTSSSIYDAIKNATKEDKKTPMFTLVATGEASVYNVVIDNSASQSKWLQNYFKTEKDTEDSPIYSLPYASATATKNSTALIDLDGEGLKAGYYYIQADNEYTDGSVITLGNAASKGTVNEKTVTTPTPTETYLKKADKVTANRGDTVEYTISFIAYNYVTENGTTQAINSYSIVDNSKAIDIDPKSVVISIKESPTVSTENAILVSLSDQIPADAEIGSEGNYSYSTDDAEDGTHTIDFDFDLSTTTTPVSNKNAENYEQAMTIDIPWQDEEGNFLYPSRSEVTITYKAVMKTNDTTEYTIGKNTTEVIYYTGKAEDEEEHSIDDDEHTVEVYSYRIQINKTDEKGDAISGATFGLVKADENGNPTYLNEDADAPRDKYDFMTIYKDKDGKYTTDWKEAVKVSEKDNSPTSPTSEEDAKANFAVDIEVDSNGKAIIYGLEDTSTLYKEKAEGTAEEKTTASNEKADYYLVELKAPDGYNLLTNAVPVKIKENYTDYTNIGVQNVKGSMLPNTGGMGTKIFYVVGGLMVAGAVIFLITNRRMKSE